jgi:hypothetical protein
MHADNYLRLQVCFLHATDIYSLLAMQGQTAMIDCWLIGASLQHGCMMQLLADR